MSSLGYLTTEVNEVGVEVKQVKKQVNTLFLLCENLRCLCGKTNSRK